MKTVKISFLVLFTAAIGLLHFCTDVPVDGSSSEAAVTLLALKSSSGEVDSTSIIDSTEKDIELLLSYHLGYFIDSVIVGIYSGPDFESGGKADTQIVLRFGPDDVRDTSLLTIRFSTGGERRITVVSYKKHGLVSKVTATVYILASPVKPENSPPQFITETPRLVYRVDEGDLVRFAVAATDIDGDPLSYSFLFEKDSLPRTSTASLENGFFEWKSATGDKGIYAIVFVVSDGKVSTSHSTTIVVGDTTFNESPEIVSTPPTTARTGVQYDYQPIANDDDAEDGFIWKLLGAMPAGMRFDSLTGRIWWIPAKGVVTSGPLLLKVTDFGFPPMSDSQRIVITVTDGNRPPVVSSQSVATGEGVPVTVRLSATDWDDSILQYEITGEPLHGTIVLEKSGSVTYTPAAGFKGVDTVFWVALDSVQSSDTARLKIYVAMENQKPVAHGQQLSTPEDVAISMVLSADDVEADDLTYMLRKNPQHGTLKGADREWVYTPYADFFGADTFTFYVNDTHHESDPAMVIIVVASVNDTPVIATMGIPTPLNTAASFVLSVNDPDDSLFLFELARTPLHGTLDSLAIPELVFTPESGFKGSDSLMYRATDESGCTGPAALIVIDIGSDNQRPVALPLNFSVLEDTEIELRLAGTDPEGAAVTSTVTKLPAHGTLSSTGQTRSYLPHQDYVGPDTLWFTVSDGKLVSEPASIVIMVEPVNDVPVVQAQSVAVSLNGTVQIRLSASDVDDTVLTFGITSLPKNGTLDTSKLSQGSVGYTPGANFKGSDTLQFVAGDASGGVSAPGLVIVSVAVTNQRPVADPQAVTINEDVTQTIFLTGSDLESSAANLVFSITSHPRFGQLQGTLPNISYKTAPDFNGVDTFWFAVNDGNLTSNPARVLIEVLPVNDAPSAVTKMVTTGLNASVNIQLQANDVDDMTFTYEVVSNPLHGAVDISGIADGWISYTPAGGFKGYDTLMYRALDAAGIASSAVPVSIGVALDNQPPVANSKNIVLNEDTPRDDLLTGFDIENSPLQFTITKSPVHGRIEGTLPQIRYVPDLNFFGTDSLRFTVSDGSATSAPAVVRFTVNPINDAPVAAQKSVTTGLNTSVAVTLTGSDVEGGLLSYHIAKMPANGTLDTSAIGSARISYAPNFLFKGIDTVLYYVTDAAGAQSPPAPVTIGVALDNQPPHAFSQEVSTPEDVALSVTISANDIESTNLTYTINTNPAHGTLAGSGQNYSYTPANNFNGSDYFEFTAYDGQLGSNTARVTITVNPVNDAPVLSTIPAQTIMRGGTFAPVQLDNYVNDPDNSDLQIRWTALAANSHVTIAINSQRIAVLTVADSSWVGTENITFTATDPDGLSRSIDMSSTVENNTVPVISSVDDILVNEGTVPGTILFTVGDAETALSALTVTAVSDNQQVVEDSAIVLGGTDDSRTAAVTPTGTPGVATITLTVFDGVLSASETFTLMVNGRPTVTDQAVTVAQDGSVAIDLEAADPESGILTYSVEDPAHGTLSGTAPNLTYAPPAGYSGSDSFTFTATDSLGFASLSATVSITVTAANIAPTATPQSVTVNENDSVAITLSGTDPEGGSLTYDIIDVPSNGTLSGAPPNVTYTPTTGYSGDDSFTFTVTDQGFLISPPATVSITVTAANIAPTATPQSVTVNENDSVAVILSGTDPEGGSLTYDIIDVPSNGTLSGAPPNVTYTPTTGYIGDDSFTFTATDQGLLTSLPATVSITVNGLPVADFTAATDGSNPSLTIVYTSTSTDPEDNTLTYEWDMGITGDTGPWTGSTVTYTYPSGGDYTVKLLVDDQLGGTDSIQKVISVPLGTAGQ